MLNIIELEKRWMRYKLKYYLPHFTISVSLTIIAVVILIFVQNDVDNVRVPIKKTLLSHEKNISKPQIKQKKVEVVTIVDKEEQLTLQPSLNFVQDMKHSKYVYVPTPKKVYKPKPKTNPLPKSIPVKIVKEKKISKISITRKDSNQDMQEIIKRFTKSNNPNLSLFIAKKYYAQKNYQQAYNYSLITNKINNQIDESWILFTKSLVKLGKKNFAIRILQDYTQETKSTPASILLSDIKSGKFR